MRRFLLSFLFFASAALAPQTSALGQQYGHGGGVSHGSVGGLSHSPGISRQSVPSKAPGMAFGGTAVRRSETVESWRDSGSVRQRESVRSERVPGEISRSWGQTGRHFWGGHYFIWSGGGWVNYDEGPMIDGYVDSTPDAAEAPVNETPAPAAAPEAAPQAAAPDQADDSLPAQVQRALTKRGYDPGPVTGSLDPQTREALTLFQKDQGLDASGRIGAQTLDTLGIR